MPAASTIQSAPASVSEELILAYLDGSLEPGRRADVERLIDSDPEARKLVVALSELSLLQSGSRRSVRRDASATLPEAGLDEPADPVHGDELAAQYRVTEFLGRGAMGVVLGVEHLHLGEERALKLIRSRDASASESTARLIREARASMNINDPHVAKVFDLGSLDDGRLFLVMERLRGEDLRKRLQRMGPLPIAQAVRFVMDAARGVAAAHRAGVVHRDLKPANLFVTPTDSGERVRVLDFGLSKLSVQQTPGEEGDLTTSSSILGSPMYMSPEQIRNARRADERSDVWSLGVVLYELLAGEPPFQAETVSGLLASIIADQPRPLRELRPEVPPTLDRIVRRCLEKDPASRVSSAEELLHRLQAWRSSGRRRPRMTLGVAAAVAVSAVGYWAYSTSRPPEDPTPSVPDTGTPSEPAASVFASDDDAPRASVSATAAAASVPTPASAQDAPTPTRSTSPPAVRPPSRPAVQPKPTPPVDPLLGKATETRR